MLHLKKVNVQLLVLESKCRVDSDNAEKVFIEKNSEAHRWRRELNLLIQ